jgi:hypothetical protein
MASLSASYHFFRALRRAAGRIFLTFLITLLVVGGATELVYFLIVGSVGLVSHVLAVAMGVGWAVALSLLVLVGEIVRGLVEGVKDTVKDVSKEVGEVGSLVGNLTEHKDKK